MSSSDRLWCLSLSYLFLSMILRATYLVLDKGDDIFVSKVVENDYILMIRGNIVQLTKERCRPDLNVTLNAQLPTCTEISKKKQRFLLYDDRDIIQDYPPAIDFVKVSAEVSFCIWHILGFGGGCFNCCQQGVSLLLMAPLLPEIPELNCSTARSETSFIFASYRKKKIKRNHVTQTPTIFMVYNENAYACVTKPATSSELEDIKQLTTSLWNPTYVGIGRDAQGLLHDKINITDAMRINVTDAVTKRYKDKKRAIKRIQRKLGARFMPPDIILEGIEPIATVPGVQQRVPWKESLDETINEVYLFHGTSGSNVSSIGLNGLVRSTTGMLGSGIYFTDSPIKADQYAEEDHEDGSFCMILSRVILGDIAIVRRSDVTKVSGASRPPCRMCFMTSISRGHLCRHVCNSVCLEGGLFREYVVYDEALALPEYVIKYQRVSSD